MKLNRWKLIFRLILNPKHEEYGGEFVDHFSSVVLYALNNYENKRGTGASDVLLYDHKWGRDIFKP